VDPPSGGGDPRAAEVAAATLGSATLPPEWPAQDYPAGSVVTHAGQVWTNPAAVNATKQPGDAQSDWRRIDLAVVTELLVALFGNDIPVQRWYPRTWSGYETVLHEGRLWRSGLNMQASKVPGVAEGWRPYDLTGLLDWTQIAVAWDQHVTYNRGDVTYAPWDKGGTGFQYVCTVDGTTRQPISSSPTADPIVPGWRAVSPAENARAVELLAKSTWGMWSGTQSAYDALPTKSASVLYVITP
jgi:hypothetical protein